MADISALGDLQPIDLNLDSTVYKDALGFKPFPVKGEYDLQAPETITFGRTKAGSLSAQIDSTIVGGEHEGTQIKFQKVSAKTFLRSGAKVSQMGDYLRACGVRSRFSDEQALADAVESTVNTTYKAVVDWRAYNSRTGFAVEGMERFPQDENGNYLPFYPDPVEKDENGNPVRLRAQLVVTRYVPKTE